MSKTRVSDEQFFAINSQTNFLIWRIEKFKLVRVKESLYGTFFTGDSYLILKKLNAKFNIHFWLGVQSTIDELTVAAIKAVELDDYLGGNPVQYREVQYNESELFKSYFPKGIRYINGGVDSALRHFEKQNKTRLYMVKGKNDVRIIEVPFEGCSLNKSDVFLLEDGESIFQWNPPGANKLERIRANTFAKHIRDQEHAGKAQIEILDDDWDSNNKFWSYFNCKANDIKTKSEVDDKQFEYTFKNSNVCLFRISDANSKYPKVEQIANGQLKKSMLDSNDCFIVDCGMNGIYTWIGRKCTKNEKIASILATKDLILKKNNFSIFIPMGQVNDGAETTSFKAIFSDWII